MEPMILASARRHGIADADIRHAYTHALYVGDVQPNGATLLICPARDGRLLEIGYRTADEGVPLIFHAMPARRKYLQ